MKKWPLIFALVFVPMFAQQPPVPQLSTSDKVAIQTLEKAKQDAAKQWQDAQQQELVIEREWMAAHPGWKIDPQTFAVSSETKSPAPTPGTKPVEPAKAPVAPKK